MTQSILVTETCWLWATTIRCFTSSSQLEITLNGPSTGGDVVLMIEHFSNGCCAQSTMDLLLFSIHDGSLHEVIRTVLFLDHLIGMFLICLMTGSTNLVEVNLFCNSLYLAFCLNRRWRDQRYFLRVGTSGSTCCSTNYSLDFDGCCFLDCCLFCATQQ